MYFAYDSVEVGDIYSKIEALTKWHGDPRSTQKIGWNHTQSFPWVSLWNFCDDIGVSYKTVYHREDGKVVSAEYFFTKDDANEVVSEYMEQWTKNAALWKEEVNTVNMWKLGVELGIGKGYMAIMDLYEAMRMAGTDLKGRRDKKLVSRDDVPQIAIAIADIRKRRAKWKAEHDAALAAAIQSNRARNEQWLQRNAEARRGDEVREELEELRAERAETNLLSSEAMIANFTDWYSGEPDGSWIQSKWDQSQSDFAQWQVDIKVQRKELNAAYEEIGARIEALELYVKKGTLPDGGIQSREDEVVLLKEARMPVRPEIEVSLTATDIPDTSMATKEAARFANAFGPWARRGNKWWPQTSSLNGLNIWERGNGSGLVRVPVKPGQEMEGIRVDFKVFVGGHPVKAALTMRKPTLAVADVTSQEVDAILGR